MTGLEPYRALYFLAADDATEVEQEYGRAYDDGGFLAHLGETYELVTVVACEQGHGPEAGGTFVYFLREQAPERGRLERRDSWQVRKHE